MAGGSERIQTMAQVEEAKKRAAPLNRSLRTLKDDWWAKQVLCMAYVHTPLLPAPKEAT